MKISEDFYNIELERAVLASLMSIEGSFLEVSSILNENDFVAVKHQNIYNAICSLANAGECYDAMMVLDQLKSSNVGESEYKGYLSDILATSPATKFNLVSYAKRVRDSSALRHADKILLASRDLLHDKDANYLDNINNVIDSLTRLATEKSTMKGAETVGELITDFAKSVVQNAVDETKPFLKTGFVEIDNKVNIQAGELVVIAGRPAQGKTALGQIILQNVVDNTQGVAVFFSMEMAKTQVLQRFMSSKANIILPKVTSGQGFKEDDFNNLVKLEEEYKNNCNLYIDDRKLTTAQMRTELNKIRKKHGKIEVVLVDYLQIVGGISATNASERSTVIADIATTLKDFSKEYNCPVIALAQLNRDAIGRPQMSHIAESAGIERIADHIWAIYRPPQPDDMPPSDVVELEVLKQRQGAIGTIRLKFEGIYTRFTDNLPT